MDVCITKEDLIIVCDLAKEEIDAGHPIHREKHEHVDKKSKRCVCDPDFNG